MRNETMTQSDFDALLVTKIKGGLVPVLDHLGELALIVGRLVAEVNELRARVAKLEGRRAESGTWPTA